jgi:2-polyprenyl-3-methyl-5-hydroxy-6-metoxy-1,4-benzoquinol methylase
MACPYCGDLHFSSSYLPSTAFNGKLFYYHKCANCKIIYIDPLPDENDYLKMYPPEYQGGVDKTILKNPYKKLSGLRFSYGYQFELLKEHAIKNPRILDYGCGNAHFICNALKAGFECDGVEYNTKQVEILRRQIPGRVFYTISDFLENSKDKYDVIRLSNVLEHMDDPNKIIKILVSKLTEKGVLLIEGPIECNFSFALLTRKIYFFCMNKIRKGYIANHTPTHITFTNSINQLSFLNKFGLTKLEYKIIEAEWPYPESFQLSKGFGEKTKALIAKLSMALSSFVPTWGNTFLYIGKNNRNSGN